MWTPTIHESAATNSGGLSLLQYSEAASNNYFLLLLLKSHLWSRWSPCQSGRWAKLFPKQITALKPPSINYFFKVPPVVSLVALPVRQVGEAVPQADDGIEAALH